MALGRDGDEADLAAGVRVRRTPTWLLRRRVRRLAHLSHPTIEQRHQLAVTMRVLRLRAITRRPWWW